MPTKRVPFFVRGQEVAMRGKISWSFGPIPKHTDNLVVLLEDGTYWPAHKIDVVYNDVPQHAGQVLQEPDGPSTGIARQIITAWVIDAKLHNAVLGAYQEYYGGAENG